LLIRISGDCGQVVRGARGAFESERSYTDFLLTRLRPGSRLFAVAGDRKGCRGSFVGQSRLRKGCVKEWMCCVQWDGSGSSLICWSHVELEALLYTCFTPALTTALTTAPHLFLIYTCFTPDLHFTPV
jgi:hypothetical protein